jgi:hypothetical protein
MNNADRRNRYTRMSAVLFILPRALPYGALVHDPDGNKIEAALRKEGQLMTGSTEHLLLKAGARRVSYEA